MPRHLIECIIVFLSLPTYSITGGWLSSALNLLSNDANTVAITNTSLPFSDSFVYEFRSLIKAGKLSTARKRALDAMKIQSPTKLKKSDIAKIYVETFQKYFNSGGNTYLEKINASIHIDNEEIVSAKEDSPNCMKIHSDWSVVDPYELWDRSCSILPSEKPQEIHLPNDFLLQQLSRNVPFGASSDRSQCCVFTPGSWTYLRLPAIHEPAIRLGIPSHHSEVDQQNHGTNSSITFLNLEQDGYLRPYDVAGILWPTGYMLSLCLGDLFGCPIPELRVLIAQYQQRHIAEASLNQHKMHQNHPILALELGAGIGASSIALAKSLQKLGPPFASSHDPNNQSWVMATDLAPYALALTMANAKTNNVHISTAIMDHFDESSVQGVKEKIFPTIEDNLEIDTSLDSQNLTPTGFSLIFGSSLQGFFQDTDRVDSALWRTLDQLIDKEDPNALVILAHNRADTLKIPHDSDFSYDIVRRISASDEFFGSMRNRAGDVSDFEISVLKLRNTQCQETLLRQ